MEREELLRAKPILFNTDMVCAILEGRKTQTRRIVKVRNDESIEGILSSPYHKEHPEISDCELLEDICIPAYDVGDIVYVREAWNFIPCIECTQSSPDKCGGVPVDYEDREMISEGCYIYRADCSDPSRIAWRPSIHMPKKAARLFLRITGVRVERLQDITLRDIYAEGTGLNCDPLWEDGVGEKSDVEHTGAPSVFACGESISGWAGAQRALTASDSGRGNVMPPLSPNGDISPDGGDAIKRAVGMCAEGGCDEADVTITEFKQMQREFMNLWDDTIREDQLPQYGWDANPFVWVYEFEEVK